MKVRVITITTSMILLAAAAGWGIFQKNAGQKTVQAKVFEPLIAVDTVRPERKTIRKIVEVYGSLSPKVTTLIKSEIPGVIQKIRVKEWDQVKPGDILLEMNPTDLTLAVQRSQAEHQMAEAQLLRAKVDLNRAKREWHRALGLKQGGLITSQEMDERQTAMELTEAQVELATAQVGQAKVRIAESRRSLEKAIIASPIQGTVSQRIVDAGDFVDKGGSLFSIVDNRILDFTASVSSLDLSLVSEGQSLHFSVDGFPAKTFQGVIKRVNPVVSSSDRSGKIIAEVKNAADILKGGLYARGYVVVAERPNVLTLPKFALLAWDMQNHASSVFVVDDGG
ncbi:MAG: efflux RND transporter periplasmic adaptor subunit, partial [Desulfatirhabdiaceae bacterium]|nr:efflux RND transporter periplasmic adaptor subunit [Desulfatirhabdiaceae bacterium]